MQKEFHIGKLRPGFTLVQRIEQGSDGEEVFVNARPIYADLGTISPFRTMNNAQVDLEKITHRATVRFRVDFNQFEYLIHERLVSGSIVTAVYRIHMYREVIPLQFTDLELEFQYYA